MSDGTHHAVDETAEDAQMEHLLVVASRRRVVLIGIGALAAVVVGVALWVTAPAGPSAAAGGGVSLNVVSVGATTTSGAPTAVRSATTVPARTTSSTAKAVKRPGTTTVVAPSATPTTVGSPTSDAPAPEAPTTSAPVAISFGLGNSSNSTSYVLTSTSAPSLNWSVQGAVPFTVTVSGPGGVSSSSVWGSVRLCPGTVGSDGVCVTEPGRYDYVLTVLDPGGAVIDTRIRTLTVS